MEKQNPLEEQNYVYIGRDGRVMDCTEQVLAEHTLRIFINDIPAGKVTCIPEHPEALILGRLLTAGIIASAGDVSRICISRDGTRGTVYLTGDYSPEADSGRLPGNHTANDNEHLFPEMKPVTRIGWKVDQIFALADYFAAGTPLHEKTWATHSCILAREDRILFTCEDISRHNALDKVIGYALQNGIPLQQCTVYSSGRIPTDMAAKAICAGIPILVSKASPTSAAIALARKYGLTLICAARKDRMKLFSGTLA